jgi:hypothetical protein
MTLQVHEYAVRPDGPRWTLTRDGRPVAGFESFDQALSTAEKITGDLARGGANVRLAAVRPDARA